MNQITIEEWLKGVYRDDQENQSMEENEMEQTGGEIHEGNHGTRRGGHSCESSKADHEGDQKGELDEREGSAAVVSDQDPGDGETAGALEKEPEGRESEDWFSAFMNLPEDPEKYGNRGDYLATLTPYGIACYIVSEQKSGNLTRKQLSDVDLLTKYFDTEVDTDGDELY